MGVILALFSTEVRELESSLFWLLLESLSPQCQFHLSSPSGLRRGFYLTLMRTRQVLSLSFNLEIPGSTHLALEWSKHVKATSKPLMFGGSIHTALLSGKESEPIRLISFPLTFFSLSQAVAELLILLSSIAVFVVTALLNLSIAMLPHFLSLVNSGTLCFVSFFFLISCDFISFKTAAARHFGNYIGFTPLWSSLTLYFLGRNT